MEEQAEIYDELALHKKNYNWKTTSLLIQLILE